MKAVLATALYLGLLFVFASTLDAPTDWLAVHPVHSSAIELASFAETRDEDSRVTGNISESLAEKSSERSIGIRWLGHASFLITTSCGTTILTDPIDFKGYNIPEGTTADIVTVSHEHIDHNCVDAVSGNPAVFRGTDKKCRNVNVIDTTIRDIRLHTVHSFHDPGHHGSNAIFVFEFDGIRLAHMGDIGTVLTNEQIAAVGNIDVLMVPVGGQFTITGEEADSIVGQLDAERLVIPMHFKTEAFDAVPYTAEPFLKGKENVRRVGGEEIVIDLRVPVFGREYILFLCPVPESNDDL